MKPIKEQIKIVLRKIFIWQKEQKNKEKNIVSAKDDMKIEKTLNNISVSDTIQVENEKLTIKERYNQIPPSERAKMMFLIEKEQKSQEEEKLNEKPAFDNEQMILHFYDIGEAIKLKHSKESISTEEDLNIIFQNQLISIEPSIVNSALAYEELNNTYKLEAKTLIEEIISRFGDGYEHITETLVVDFLKEILKQKKLQDEKEAFKRKIVWLKK